MSDTVIKVEGLYKKFCRSLKRSMAYGTFDIARSMLGIPYDRRSLRPGEFWALENVNLELRKGEALGIIGQNGSGKTTLLRLINGIFPPDKGKITITGRIGALLAVGAGFHPHMTGRENIYLNGTILGMTKEEIQKKYDSIVDFADIGEFLEAPVATYSSGMTVRLGFSIAVHSNPEILLADEVLAVGDLQFALKCYRKVTEYRQNGGSLILVSHSMSLLRNSCKKVLWIDHGKTKEYGDVQSICDLFESYMMKKDAVNTDKEGIGNKLNYDPYARITKVEFLDGQNQICDEYNTGEIFKIRIHFDCKRIINKPIFSVTFINPENIIVICHFTYFDNYNIQSISGNGSIDFVIDKLPLKPSQYKCSITFTDNGDINSILEWHDRSYSFIVSAKNRVTYGLVNSFPEWILNSNTIESEVTNGSDT